MKLCKFILAFALILNIYSCGEDDTTCFDYESCSQLENEININESDAYKAVSSNVKLIMSNYYIESAYGLPPYTMNHILEGEIEVKNIAYNKQVVIHYIGSDNQTWIDANATYSRPSTRMGYEYWYFSITTPIYKSPPDKLYTFAIKYVVNGSTYWDNNNNQNYYRTFSKDVVKLKKANFYLTSANAAYLVNAVLETEIEVKKISAVNKTVGLHYVGSDAKWKDAKGTYLKPSTRNGYEIWKVVISTQVYVNPPQTSTYYIENIDSIKDFYRFAVKYSVKDSEYWDNNNNQDYYGRNYGVTPR